MFSNVVVDDHSKNPKNQGISQAWCYSIRFLLFQIRRIRQAENVINTLRPRQDGHHIPDDIFKWIFLNENVWISITISLKFVQKGPINIIPALVQIMAWRRPGDKPLSEQMVVGLLTHICVIRPQWVNTLMAGPRRSLWGGLHFSMHILDKTFELRFRFRRYI